MSGSGGRTLADESSLLVAPARVERLWVGMTATYETVKAALDAGGEMLVALPNGNAGKVWRDNDYYPGEPVYMFTVHEGWGAGVAEPICETDSRYWWDSFLTGARWSVATRGEGRVSDVTPA